MTFSVKSGKLLPVNCQMHCLKFPDGSVFSCCYYNFMVCAVLSFLRNILFQVAVSHSQIIVTFQASQCMAYSKSTIVLTCKDSAPDTLANGPIFALRTD